MRNLNLRIKSGMLTNQKMMFFYCHSIFLSTYNYKIIFELKENFYDFFKTSIPLFWTALFSSIFFICRDLEFAQSDQQNVMLEMERRLKDSEKISKQVRYFIENLFQIENALINICVLVLGQFS